MVKCFDNIQHKCNDHIRVQQDSSQIENSFFHGNLGRNACFFNFLSLNYKIFNKLALKILI